MQLSDREWKQFNLSGKDGIFKNYHGKRLIKDNRVEGRIPLLTAGENNQGFAGFISNTDMPIFKDFISIDMFGNAFYHEHICSGDDNIYFFVNDNLSKNVKLFITNGINMNKKKYSYGKQFRQKNADKEKIMLPIKKTDDNIPDWDFMESYIKELVKRKKDKYNEYLSKTIKEMTYKEIPEPKSKRWESVLLTDLFYVKKGNQNNMNSLASGDIPLVSAKKIDNGYKDFVQDEKERIFAGNCITINNDGDGGAGLAYYQPHAMAVDSHVTALYAKENLSKYTLLFISRCLTMQSSRFNHAYSLNNARIQKFKFMVPIDEKGQPDYEYMEQYIKNLTIRKYQQYISIVSERRKKA